MKFVQSLLSVVLLLNIFCISNFELTGGQREPISKSKVIEYQEIPNNAEVIGNFTVSLGSFMVELKQNGKWLKKPLPLERTDIKY